MNKKSCGMIDKFFVKLKPAELYTHPHTCSPLLRIKQIGTICFAISILFSAPSFADPDIPSSASSANCRNDPLQTYSGTSNLTAGWQANTIALHWYNGDDEIQNVPVASQSCTYDSTLTPPTTIPTRTGYTFKGWRARQATPFGYHSLLSNVSVQGEQAYAIGYDANATNGDYCSAQGTVLNGNTRNTSTFCQNSIFSDMNRYEWRVLFDYGDAYGLSACSAKVGNNNGFAYDNDISNWRATDAQLTEAGNGSYCWCRAKGFKPTGESLINKDSAWYYAFYYSGNSCLYDCANTCAIGFKSYSSVRQAAYENE